MKELCHSLIKNEKERNNLSFYSLLKKLKNIQINEKFVINISFNFNIYFYSKISIIYLL
jgi:histidyl-tRNA synthetase